MAWKECDLMSLREEFVSLATHDGTDISELCRRYGISRKTGYKWLGRYQGEGREGLRDRSRRPKHSPNRTPSPMEEAVLKIRERHPAWGGRKIRRRLQDMGETDVPSASTVTTILRRHDRIETTATQKPGATGRFEYEFPNDLWQMDFKGHFGLRSGKRCHPLTVLDDHSRFSLGLRACDNERGTTVQRELIVIFRTYGLPRAMLMDNGPPWGMHAKHQHTELTTWLMEQGIRVIHGRPYHPQTQGKEERFHRTLKAELLRGSEFRKMSECQMRFDEWRDIYNTERPHEALGLEVPASRYRMSPRSFVDHPAVWDYGPGSEVRKIYSKGIIHFRGQEYRVGKAFRGKQVGLRPLSKDGCWGVYYCRTKIREINLRNRS